MFDSNLIKIILGAYAIFAGIVCVLLWQNAAAPDANKNVGILVASILPIVILVFPYLKEESSTTHLNFTLFYDSTAKSIITGFDRDNPSSYSSQYIPMFTGFHGSDSLKADNLSEAQTKGFNIIENGILQTLMLKFFNNWDIEINRFQGPIARSESWGGGSKVSKETISSETIQQIFRDNPIIASGSLPPFNLILPPKTTITTEKRNNLFPVIIFDNPYVTVEISISSVSAITAQHGVWGFIDVDPKNINRYYAIEYKTALSLKLKGWKVYSPETYNYKKWFQNILDILKQFDWSVVDKETERNLTRKAVSKILGIANP